MWLGSWRCGSRLDGADLDCADLDGAALGGVAVDGAAVDDATGDGAAVDAAPGVEGQRLLAAMLFAVTVGAAHGDAALGSRRCDLQRSYCFWQWCGPRRGGVALGWLSVVVWPAAALDGVTLGGGALGGGMALTLSGAALGGDSVSAAVGPSVTVWPSAAMCGSPELPCEPPCLIR